MSRQGGMVYARVTPEEWDLIRERMREAGMTNTSAYIRKMALNGYVINVDLGDVKEVLRLLRINSNNLNQYAKRANETGSIYEADIKDRRKDIRKSSPGWVRSWKDYRVFRRHSWQLQD